MRGPQPAAGALEAGEFVEEDVVDDADEESFDVEPEDESELDELAEFEELTVLDVDERESVA